MAEGCKLSSIPIDEGDQHGRHIGYQAVPQLPPVYRVFAHHDCVHNQFIAIRNRVCGKTKYQPNVDYMARLHKFMRRVGKSLTTTGEWTLEQVVQHYHGSKRERYRQAAEDYRTYGVSRKDALVKLFVKCEKIPYQTTNPAKFNPDPRAIQYRNPVFSVLLATYLKPIEEKVYQLRGNRLNGLPKTRCIGKGLNQTQRATLLRAKWKGFVDPVALSLDASRFDQHVSWMHLLCEHALYLAMNNSPEFAQLLSWQINNEGVTTRGIRYSTKGKRMSGDMNTALGNCVLMVCMLALYFEDKAFKWDCLDDGDDILVIVEREFVQQLRDELPCHFANLGMDLKVENDTDIFEKIEWCQSNPVEVDGVWKFIRNPAKVLSGALVGHKWVQMVSPRSRRALANTIGLCESILNRGVPVLSEFAQAIVRNAATLRQVRTDQADQLVYRVRRELNKSWLKKIPVVAAEQISASTRLSFSKAFGVDVETQLSWESYLRNWTFGFDEPVRQSYPIRVVGWEWTAEDVERY